MKKAVTITIVVLIVLIILIYFYYVSYYSNRITYLHAWNLSIPSDFAEIYIISIVGFHGDGWRYYVFEPKNNTHLPFFNEFQINKNEELEIFVNNVLDNLEADEKYSIPFGQPYLWLIKKRNENTLAIIYSPHTCYYYFVQCIM